MLLLCSAVVWASPEPSHGCQALQSSFPSKTFMPGSAVYAYETQHFWSNTEILDPGCVFRPESAADVSEALLKNNATYTEFALRGGGHMGIPVRYSPWQTPRPTYAPLSLR